VGGVGFFCAVIPESGKVSKVLKSTKSVCGWALKAVLSFAMIQNEPR
jgi:hypothetical protein